MPTAARFASSKATCNSGRFITLLSLSGAGASRTGGASAHFLRAIVDARLAERERVLRREIAVMRGMVRELAR